MEPCLCYRNATRALLRLEWLRGAVYAEGHHVTRDGAYGGHGWLELGGELIDPTWAHFLLHPHPRFPVRGGRYFAAARFTRDEVVALFATYSPATLDEDEGDVDWCTPLLIKAGYAQALDTNHPAWLAASILAARAAWPGHDEVSGEEDRKKMIAALAAPPRQATEAILTLVAGAVARGDSGALDIRGLVAQPA
jgi:hypothetical protein